MPYRKLRISDGLLSLLIGYTLIPLMLFINSVSGLFSTNYVQGSVQELVAYPFWLQLLIIAVLLRVWKNSFPWIDLSFLQKKWNFRGSGA